IKIENKPGAAQTIAANEVYNSEPDGYTVTQIASAALTIQPNLKDGDTDYNLDELTPIANMTSGAQLFVASEDSSIDSIDDLIDYAQKNPKELDVGISGKENLQ